MCIGIFIGGIGGALLHNNSSPAMFLTEKAVHHQKYGTQMSIKKKN
jgi:hypothetical protein